MQAPVVESFETPSRPTARSGRDLVDLLIQDPTPAERERVEAALADDGSLWDPLPLTLPTYVNKARARRTVRTIELTGISSSGHDEADTAMAREAETAAASARAGRRRAQGRRRLSVTGPIRAEVRRGGNFFLALPGAWGCGAVGSASRSQ